VSARGELDSVTVSIFDTNVNSSTFLELEGHTKLFCDGTQVQEWGGTEDAYGGHFYGTQFRNHSNRWSIVYVGAWVGVAGTAFVAHKFWRRPTDQFCFNTSAQINWTNGQNGTGAPGASGIAASVLYYTDH
jgi:hypothetical protein